MIKYYFHFVAIVFAIVFIIACSKKEADMSPDQEQQIKQIGEASAEALMKNLKQHLMEAMSQGETVEALEFCATQAMALTEEVQDNLQPGVQIKRTSFKYRNPANAPDAHEKTALTFFKTAKNEGKPLPEHLIQTLVDKSEYRFYKPMKVATLCLKCHGSIDQLDPAVKKSLSENYPSDLAVNYQVDDFRGLIRISIPAELISK